MTNRDDIYNQVTEQIITDLEAGHIPWERPWSGGFLFPQNAATMNTYNGINVLILWMRQRKSAFESSQWLTFNQAQELGASIKKGEKATRIIYYKSLNIEDKNDNGETETKTIPMLKTHSVFNICQTEGLESLLKIERSQFETFDEPKVCEKAEAIVSQCGAKLSFDGGAYAFYNVNQDLISLPPKKAFKDQLGFYATVLHELTHWTGAESRLNRNLGEITKAGHEAKEELIAELGSSFLCAQVGLEYTSQHAAYVESWLKVLKNDKSAIFKAASQARVASEFLLKSTH
jgi:antirestriction protein ArdC